MTELKFHHTGLLVEDIEYSLQHYIALFGSDSISEIYTVSSQKVKVCFVKNGSNSHLELVQPISDDSGVSKMLKKRISYYHIAYLVNDINAAINKLESLNYKSLEPFNSEAFNGKTCVFLYTPDGHLVELIAQ